METNTASIAKEAIAALHERPRRICPLTTDAVADRCILFIEQLSGVEFYAYQLIFARRMVQSVLLNDASTITGLWARQCGKTEVIANTCVGLAVILPELAREFPDDERFHAFKKGFNVGVYAPIDEQAKISFGRMRSIVVARAQHADDVPRGADILEDAELNVQVLTNRGDTLSFSNGSTIIAKSASEQSQIEGKTHHLVVCEESQKLSRTKVDKEISPMLASTNGSMVKIGTAWISRGGFHLSIQQNVEAHKQGGIRNHFEIPYDVVIREKQEAYKRTGNAFHTKYEKFVGREIVRLGGESSEEFRMNYMCLWQESRVIAVNIGIFKSAARRELERYAHPFPDGMYVAGLDVAKVSDSSILTNMYVDTAHPIRNTDHLNEVDEDKQIYYHKTICDWLELGGPFEGNTGQYKMLIEYLRDTRVQILCIDATAMGNPVFERIQALVGDDIVCIPFIFGLISKSSLYKYYLQELHAGRLHYAAGQHTKNTREYQGFVLQHMELDRVQHGGYAVCEAPEGGHDDYPDSGALACWAEKEAESVLMPEVVATSASGGGRPARGGGSTERTSGGSRGRYGSRW